MICLFKTGIHGDVTEMIVKYATVTGNYSKSAVVCEKSLQISLKIYIGTTLEQITTIHELLIVQI